jgi:SAM-dependent methyltransferase
MTCKYTVTDKNGNEITLVGQADFKAYLVDGGLSHLYPDGNFPWLSEKKDSLPTQSDKNQSPLATLEEYHYKEADSAYSHSSRYGAQAARDSFVKSINNQYERLNKDLNDEQKQYLDESFIQLKKDYLEKEKPVLSARSGIVSAHIAGGSKFKSSLVTKGQSALDRATENHANWFKDTIANIEQGIKNRRNDDQLASDTKKAENKAYIKAVGSFAGTIGAMNDPGNEKALFMNSAKRNWAALKAIGNDEAYKAIGQINKALEKESTTIESVIGKRSHLWKEISQFLTEYESNQKDNAESVAKDNQEPEVKAESTQETQEKEAESKVDTAEPDAETETTTIDPANPIDAFNFIMQGLNEGTISIDEYKKGFEDAIANKDAIIAELSKRTKDDLVRAFGLHWHKSEKKDVLVRMAYDDALKSFSISKGISYVLGGKDSFTNALRKNVEALTQEDLDSYAAKRKEAIAERKKEIEEKLEGIKDPKTLDDFRNYMKVKMQEEKLSFQDARMTLNPDKRAKYDALVAENSRSTRNYRKERDADYVATNRANTDAEIVKTVHTRDGYDLWVVKAAERVERDIYNDWNATAKKLGGWYSKFRGNGAIPGFQFKTEEGAQAFQQYISKGDKEAVQEQAKARRDVYQDDKTQGTVERLTEMADRLEESANESLNQNRKVNTVRRADMAANAAAKAQNQIALAKTMKNIANAISSGKANFLDRVRQKVQVEFLQGIVSSAHYRQLMDETKGSYGEYEKRKYEEPTQVTADYAEFPSYSAYRSDLASLARQLIETDGTKQLGKDLLKVADDVTDAYLKFAETNIPLIGGFRTNNGEPAKFTSMKQAEKSIAASGYNGKAIPFKVPGRSGVIPILSPSEAQIRGIWKGDNDKRITLDYGFGNKLITALGKANRKQQKVSVPWQFERAHSDISRLQKMGIESPAEFRAALREFIDLKEQPEQEDKIKKLERRMVGRANDGLDFFPTPQSVADEMIAASDIQEGMKVLEPSAGMGHIADQIRDAGVDPDVIELSPNRRELLEAKGHNIVANDFMDYNEGGYDRIIMNPPFSDRRDAAHVQHAYDLLKPGGRLVAIMGEGVFFGSDKKASSFMDWLDSVGGEHEKMAENTFMDKSLPVTTGVNTRMVVIDKPLSGEETNNDELKYSRSKTVRGSSVAQVKSWIPSKMRKLVDSGKLVIVQNVNEVIPSAQAFDAGGIEGFYSEKRDILYLVANNIHKDNFKSVLHHELFHRLENTDPKLKAAIAKFDSDFAKRFELASKGKASAIENKAYQRVIDADTPLNEQLSEFKAYLISLHNQNPKSVSEAIAKIIRELVAAIKVALVRAGVPLESLSAADLNALVVYSVQKHIESVSSVDGDIKYSKASDIVESLQESETWDNVVSRFDGLSENIKNNIYALATQRQLVDIGKKALTDMPKYLSERTRMNKTVETLMQKSDGITKKWEQLVPHSDVPFKDETNKQANKEMQEKLADAMHIATVLGYDPRKPFEGDKDSPAHEEYKQVLAEYMKLNKNAKEVFNEAAEDHQDHIKQIIGALKKQIENSGATQEAREEMLKQLDNNLKESQKIYFPLSRFGDYWLYYTKDGIQYFNMFETENELRTFRKQNKDIEIESEGKKFAKMKEIDGVSSEFLSNVNKLLDEVSSVNERDKIRDAMYQLYLQLLPDLSASKHFIHRKKTPGYHEDALRGFAKKAFHDAKMIGRLKHRKNLEQYIEQMRKAIETAQNKKTRKNIINDLELMNLIVDDSEIPEDKADAVYAMKERYDDIEKDPIKRNDRINADIKSTENILAMGDNIGDDFIKYTRILDELQSSHDAMMNPNTSSAAVFFNSIGFLNYLGFSPSAALVNTLQTPTVSLPFMASRYGFGKASGQLQRAFREFIGNKNSEGELSIEGSFKDKDSADARAFQEMHDRGILTRTRAMDLIGLSEEGVAHGTARRKLMYASAYMFNRAEILNREVTGMTAFRLAYNSDKLKALPEDQRFNQAIEYADEVINTTHGDYTQDNRSRIMRGNVKRVIFQFKQYSQLMTYLWGKAGLDAIGVLKKKANGQALTDEDREAGRLILGMISMQASAAGVMGLPIGGFMVAAQLIADSLDSDDEPFDVEAELKKWIYDNFTDAGNINDAIVRGPLTAWTGLDFNSRVNQSDMWFREPDKDLEGDYGVNYLAETLGGPIVGMAASLLDAKRMIGDGHLIRGIENLMPKSIKDPLVSLRYSEEGARNMRGDLIDDTNIFESIAKAGGFNSADLALKYDENFIKKRIEREYKNRYTNLMDMAARAKIDKDSEAFNDAWSDIEEWNKTNPTMRITRAKIAKSVKQRMKTSRKMDNGFLSDKRLKDQTGQFDFTD